MLTLHLVFAAIMLGNMVTFLILSITAAATDDIGVLKSCFTAMQVLAGSSVRAATIGTVVTGIVLSVMTHWGLIKYYWLIVKELLTILAIGLNFIGMYVWTHKAVQLVDAYGIQTLSNPSFAEVRLTLFFGIGIQILSLVAMYVLSVYKPWGQRRRRQE
jgi:ABC-type uncharacterized transport system permease subunit